MVHGLGKKKGSLRKQQHSLSFFQRAYRAEEVNPLNLPIKLEHNGVTIEPVRVNGIMDYVIKLVRNYLGFVMCCISIVCGLEIKT